MNHFKCYNPSAKNLTEGLASLKEQLSCSFEKLQRTTFFIDARDAESYQRQFSEIATWMEKYFPSALFEVIAQPPVDNSAVAAECFFVSANTYIECIETSEVKYHKVHYSTHTEIHAFGLNGYESDSFENWSEQAFKKATAVLTNENIDFTHVVRQWNYIEEIISVHRTEANEIQNYQVFNDVRSKYYSQCEFKNGYPAATGIGTKSGGVSISFIAIDPKESVKISAVTNTRQIDAHNYSEQVLVGTACTKTSPKFERAKIVASSKVATNYISGTAAIIGEDTIPNEDYAHQTIETLNNIDILINRENAAVETLAGNAIKSSMQHLRVYINKIENAEVVKQEVFKRYPTVPVNYVEADVCRDNLLVEIESVMEYLLS
ncbi:hypothetical protein EMN47_18830 [Prolixibacteraceae bacterium JC049]|nr:hypothetical protein [Prolixibacteraceae bacterium JC049]